MHDLPGEGPSLAAGPSHLHSIRAGNQLIENTAFITRFMRVGEHAMTFTPSFPSQSRTSEIISSYIPQGLPASVRQTESESRRPGFVGRLPILSVASVITLALMLCCPASAQYSYSVTPGGGSVGLLNGSGEVQSAVIAPGVNSQCPGGRLFVTMDELLPPQAGTVIGSDLNSPAQIQSTFDADPDSAHDGFFTQDNDILSLPNGDLLLLWGVHIDAPLMPKPAWFDITYHGAFGPGTRRGTAVYRSKDCGKSFQFVTKIDPATLGDGKCAFPQPSKPPQRPQLPYNGGSDGQLAKLAGGSLYLTMDCVGLLPDPSKSGFVLSSNAVNRTYVLQSNDEGSSWNNLGFMNGDGWRTDIEPLPNGDLALAFGLTNFIAVAHKLAGAYVFDPIVIQPSVPWGWPDAQSTPFQIIKANQLAETLLTRIPGSGILAMAYPASIKDSHNQNVDGFELFFFNPATNQFSQAAPIFPNSHLPGNYLLHMVAIDPGQGPILLYWMDVNGNEQQATMMGRFIFADGSYSNDFSVATTIDPSSPQAGGTIHTRDYTFAVSRVWYGDYHTAGGYAPAVAGAVPGTFHYYPMWVQSDGNAHYSHVILTAKFRHVGQRGPSTPLSIGGPQWRKAPPRVEIGRILATSQTEGVEESPSRGPGPEK
jgi:hypothetical protein